MGGFGEEGGYLGEGVVPGFRADVFSSALSDTRSLGLVETRQEPNIKKGWD